MRNLQDSTILTVLQTDLNNAISLVSFDAFDHEPTQSMARYVAPFTQADLDWFRRPLGGK
jgi:hypothetical protein